MSDDLERRLDRWGTETPTEVDPAFANRLDTDLRRMHLAGADRRPRPIWQPALGLVVACLVVLAGSVVFLRAGDDRPIDTVVATAINTEVVFPDGTLASATEGLVLPDGTKIIVGPDGSASIGEVVLEPGDEAIVHDGSVEVLSGDERATPATSADRPVSTTEHSPTTTLPTSSTARPTSTVVDSTTTTGRASTSTSTPPSTEPTPTERPTTTVGEPPTIQLAADLGPDRVRLVWTYDGTEGPGGWEIVATRGDRSRVLALLRDPDARSLTLERAPDATVVYRVIARRSGGGVIAESNPVAVETG